MPDFFDIPPEILHQILCLVQPDDIENLVLTCKYFHIASTSLLAEHRRLKCQYTVISHSAHVSELSPVHQLSHLLKTIINRPRVGLYIRKIIVRGIQREWVTGSELGDEESNPGLALGPRDLEDDVELFKRVSCQFPTSSTPTYMPISTEEWHTNFKGHNQAAVLGLIMLHCPNLSIFDFEVGESHPDLIFNLFDAIDIGKSCNSLDRLRHVRFRHLKWGNGVCGPNINHVKMLLGLPAMESIEIFYMERTDHDQISVPVPYRTSNVHSLTFVKCEIRDRAFFELLEATRQLKSLTLHDTTLDVHLIKVAVMGAAKDGLEYLSLYDNGQVSEYYLGSLKPFTALRTLDLDVGVLKNPNCSAISNLEAHLPAALQSLALTLTNHGTHYLHSLLSELELMMNANVDGDVFPHLSQVTLFDMFQGEADDNRDILRKVRKGFARQGVKFFNEYRRR
ncbi:MAG: hypothetical protein LQ346_008078 [Caloplaca aetnensis]|nr:MAG: hypothetical protein LQ346_008078 [Caloplaca aetnensis]